MASIIWAKQIKKVYQRNQYGELVYDDHGEPLEEQQYFRTKDGELIPVPGDGFVIRCQGNRDYAITKEEMTEQFERHLFGGGLGYPAGKSTRWRRYTPRT